MIEDMGEKRRVPALPWWALTGVWLGIASLVVLVAVAAAAPIDPDSGLTEAGFAGLRVAADDLQLRSAALLIVIGVVVALFASSVVHTRQLATAERQLRMNNCGAASAAKQ